MSTQPEPHRYASEATCLDCGVVNPEPVYYPNAWYCRSCRSTSGSYIPWPGDISGTAVPNITQIRHY